MLGHGINRHPAHLVIFQGVGDEVDAPKDPLAAGGGDAIDPPLNLAPGVGLVGVAGAQTDDVDQANLFAAEGLIHRVGGLLLAVKLAAVGHGGALEQVGRVIGAIIKMPECFLVPGGRHLLVLLDLEEPGGLGEPRPRITGEPAVAVMGTELPGRRSTHRESTNADPIVVDLVLLLGGVESLQNVDLARESEGVAEAAVRMENDRVGRGEDAKLMLALVDEVDLAEGLATAVEPEVEPVAVRGQGRVGGGHDQAVRLDRAVDLGDVTANDQAGAGGPGGVAVVEILGPGFPLFELSLGLGDLLGIEELLIFECVVNRLVERSEYRAKGRRPWGPSWPRGLRSGLAAR